MNLLKRKKKACKHRFREDDLLVARTIAAYSYPNDTIRVRCYKCGKMGTYARQSF